MLLPALIFKKKIQFLIKIKINLIMKKNRKHGCPHLFLYLIILKTSSYLTEPYHGKKINKIIESTAVWWRYYRADQYLSLALSTSHTHTRKCVYSQRIYKYIYGCIRIYNNRRILYRRLCACVNIRAWVGASSVFIIALETRVKLLFWPGTAKTKKKEKV